MFHTVFILTYLLHKLRPHQKILGTHKIFMGTQPAQKTISLGLALKFSSDNPEWVKI